MDRDEMDKFFEKMLGPDKGRGQGYRSGWVSCDIARTTGGHLLTFHYKGEQMDYVRKFSLTEAQGREALPVLFPAAFKKDEVRQMLAEGLKKTQEALVDAQAVADASARYSARVLEERDMARKELAEWPGSPHPANRLYQAIVSAVEEFFPEGSRDLEWDVLPGSLRRRMQELQAPSGRRPCISCGNPQGEQCPSCRTPPLLPRGTPETPMERLSCWFGNYHGEEGEPMHRDVCEVLAMAYELVEARKALSDLGVETGHLPGLILSLKGQLGDLKQKIKAVREAGGQPDDDTTPEDQWVRIYDAKLRGHLKAQLELTQKWRRRAKNLAQSLSEYNPALASWEGKLPVYAATRAVGVEVWVRPFNSTKFHRQSCQWVVSGDNIFCPKGMVECEVKELPRPDGGKCASHGCEGFGCQECDKNPCGND